MSDKPSIQGRAAPPSRPTNALPAPAQPRASPANGLSGAGAGAASPDHPKNKGRDWLVGRLKALEHAQTQYVLTAGLILRHHVDARQLGLAPGTVRAPRHLLAHLERTRQDYSWIRAEVEQYAGRMRIERPTLSPDLPPAPLPRPEAAAAPGRSAVMPRSSHPPGISKTQPLGAATPTYLKQPGQTAPSPLRNPTMLTPALASGTAAPIRPQAVSAPNSSLDVLSAAKTPESSTSAGLGQATPSVPGRPASTSQLMTGRLNTPSQQALVGLPGQTPPIDPPSLPKQPNFAAPAQQVLQPSPPPGPESTLRQSASPETTKARPKPKPRLAQTPAGLSPATSSPGAMGGGQATLSTSAQAAGTPTNATSTSAVPVAVVAPSPAPTPALKLPMPQPSDFLPGGISGPPLVPQQQQQPFLNAATGQQLTAADVEGMTSEEAQRILDSFQQAAGQTPAFGAFSADSASFAAGAAATAPPIPGAAINPSAIMTATSAYPAPPPGGQDLAFDPAMLGELDLSLMGDLFGSADGSAGIDWDEVMKGVTGADGQQQQ